MAVSPKEEDVSPEADRKCFLTGLSEGLPDHGDALFQSCLCFHSWLALM